MVYPGPGFSALRRITWRRHCASSLAPIRLVQLLSLVAAMAARHGAARSVERDGQFQRAAEWIASAPSVLIVWREWKLREVHGPASADQPRWRRRVSARRAVELARDGVCDGFGLLAAVPAIVAESISK